MVIIAPKIIDAMISSVVNIALPFSSDNKNPSQSVLNIRFPTSNLIRLPLDDLRYEKFFKENGLNLWIPPRSPLSVFSPLTLPQNSPFLPSVIDIERGRNIPPQFPMFLDERLKILYANLPTYRPNRESFRKINRISLLRSF